MTKAERLFWQRVQNRASTGQPEVDRAILRAFDALKKSLKPSEVAKLIEGGKDAATITNRIFTDRLLDRAFAGVGNEIRRAVEKSVRTFTKDLPNAGKVNGVVAVEFNILNPKVLKAVKKLNSTVMTDLKKNVRESVRQAVRAGIKEGANPRTIARGIRDVVGLTPSQEKSVRNMRRLLTEGKREALTRKLRDKRFDSVLERALGRGGEGLTTEQINRYTDAYRTRFIAHSAETISRSATLDATRLGQRMAWEDAVDKGLVDPERLMKRWITVGDNKVRDEHEAMNGEEVLYDEPFSNGDQIPGENDYNCRCAAYYFSVRSKD